jgi:hypothetical protein
LSRDIELMAIESQIRDCVNRTSRKPFRWGGLSGYQQLETIGQILRSLPCREIDTDYLSLLSVWIDQALSNNLSVALDLEQAHQWLRRIADCLCDLKKILDKFWKEKLDKLQAEIPITSLRY